jgi:HAE1 family hydrophobic/amphiphilic exporter-1
VYGAIERVYLKMLSISMRYRWAVAIAIVVTFATVIPLGKAVQKNFLPIEDESRFEITIRAPEGTSVQQTRVIADRMARATRELPGVAYTVTTVGSPPGDASGRGPNQAGIFVAMVPTTERSFHQQDTIARVRNEILPRFSGENLRTLVTPVNAFGGGGADSAGIQYVMRGPELDRLADYSQQLLERVKHIPGVVDADTTLVVGRPEYSVRIERQRAADLGVSVADIANTLRLLVGDVQVSTYNEGGEQYEVHLLGNLDLRSNPQLLEQVTVPAQMPGRSVRLSDVVSFQETTGPTSIMRLARQRQVTIYANVLPGISEAGVIAQIEAARQQINMEPGYSGELAGRSKELGKAGKSFLVAFILSLVFMYLVLAAQFESWIHPVTILLSLPLTVPFAILSLVVLGQSMNIFSTLGILVLFGIVKKNSILQVDHMRSLRRRGLERADAVMIGNRDRLRPILMTTIAFVAGMIPLVVSSGAGAGTNRAMGSVIIGGQTLSLLLTLLATPVVFTFFDDLSHSPRIAMIGRGVSWPFRMLDRLFGGKSDEPVSAPARTATTADNAAE